MKKSLALLFASLFFTTTYSQIVINEIMQSNIDCIMDDLNDFPDSWVELYNSGSSAVDLSGYSLGTSSDPSEAWKLPAFQLESKSYVLVYCDKEAKSWHTDFRLESGKGCELYLFKGTEVADCLPADMKKQPAPNIAFGRKTDGGDKWGYQETPTPQKANCGVVYDNKKILGDPVFSVPGSVFTESAEISLELSVPDGSPAETEIRYTTDYTEPTAASPLYEGPIVFSGTKVVRAKLFCKGYLSPRSVTQSYIKFPRNVTLPVVSITTDRTYFFDSKIGIYVDGNYSSGKKNYEYNWRRPINFEYFETSGVESSLNQLCEARVTGGASRGAALKSLGIYANKRFGEKRLAYEFFPDQRPGISNFKSVMMRNAGNDFDYLYMRDAVIQRIMAENVDIDWQAWRPAIFFLNGVYKGMLNIRERSNEDNIFTNYNELEDIDMIENWDELKEGSKDSWNAFKAYYNEHGHTYEDYDKLLDVQEFMNVMIMNLFFCNLDFPGNNIVFWRPQAEGGRWRVIVKDTDFGLGLYGRSSNYNTLEWLHNPNYDADNAWANKSDHTRLFRRLMEDERFKREFIDRCAIYMGDFMNHDRTWEIWKPMYDLIKFEYPNHRKLFNEWWPNYNNELTSAQNWLKQRTGNFYTHLQNYYKLGSPRVLVINRGLSQTELDQIKIKFNGVQLSRSVFNGRFFEGRKVVLEGENVKGWQISETTSLGGTTTKVIDGSTCELVMPACSILLVKAIVGTPDGLEQIKEESHSSEISEIYDAMGVKHMNLEKGYNIIKNKDGKAKKVIVK